MLDAFFHMAGVSQPSGRGVSSFDAGSGLAHNAPVAVYLVWPPVVYLCPSIDMSTQNCIGL